MAVALVLAACTTVAPTTRPASPSAVSSPSSALVTPRPTAFLLPSISWKLDPTLTAWAKDAEHRTRAVDDGLVMGYMSSDESFLAYDPTAQHAYTISLPRGAETMYPYFADGLRVGGSLQAKPGKDVPPFAFFDLGSGTVTPLGELPGFRLQVYGRNDGYAYGVADKGSGVPFDPVRHTNAFVADLATGAVIDVSPTHPPGGERFEVRGVSQGRAMVVWLAATAEASAIHRIELVDIRSGAREDVDMTAEQLAAIADGWDEFSLGYWDGHIFGYFADADLSPAHPFQYDVAARTVVDLPCGGWKRLAPSRFVCFERHQTNGPLPSLLATSLIYDATTGTTTPIPWPDVTEISVETVGKGLVLRNDGKVEGAKGPALFDTNTRAMSYLDVMPPPGWLSFPVATTFAIVGDVIVAGTGGDGWTDGGFDPRVWPLP